MGLTCRRAGSAADQVCVASAGAGPGAGGSPMPPDYKIGIPTEVVHTPLDEAERLLSLQVGGWLGRMGSTDQVQSFFAHRRF